MQKQSGAGTAALIPANIKPGKYAAEALFEESIALAREMDDRESMAIVLPNLARVVIDLLHHDERSLPSRVEIRPSKPPKK